MAAAQENPAPGGKVVERTSAGPAVFPDSHAGQCAGAFVEAFNSGDKNQMRAFEESHRAKSALEQRPMEDRLRQYEEMKADWGKITLRDVVGTAERELTALLHMSRPDALFEFRFVFEEQKPFGLHHIEIQGPVTVDIGGGAGEPLSSEFRKSTVGELATVLENNYVFPETGAKMAAMLREKAKSGAYEQVESPSVLARRLTDDLRGVCNDKHLTVRPGALPDLQGGGPMRRRGTPDDARRDNFGFRKVELLPGNIGYIRLDEFHPSDEAKQVAAGAMAFLANCDTLIIDLRQNGGGSPEMIRFLSSYLFDKPTHLNSFYDRSNNKTEEFWTMESVPGKRLGEKLPVFVLTSKYTFSGAEEFAYNLRNLERATIVGETTGGGAHPVTAMRINDTFSVMVPHARAVNPITKTNWEGVGVKPHVEVSASEALDKACELAGTRKP